jgi:hypothetical protein
VSDKAAITYKFWSLGGGTPAPAHCTAHSSCKQIFADSTCPSAVNGEYTVTGQSGHPIKVSCDMANGGWQLIYSRDNYAFSPDHMRNVEPSQFSAGVNPGQVNSNSWWIPTGATKWKWDVSRDGASPEYIETNIPSQAYQTTTDGTSVNTPLSGVSYGGGMHNSGGTLYYQRAKDQHGCSSGTGTWYGLVHSSQGMGDASPNGIGTW